MRESIHPSGPSIIIFHLHFNLKSILQEKRKTSTRVRVAQIRICCHPLHVFNSSIRKTEGMRLRDAVLLQNPSLSLYTLTHIHKPAFANLNQIHKVIICPLLIYFSCYPLTSSSVNFVGFEKYVTHENVLRTTMMMVPTLPLLFFSFLF